MKLKLVLAGLLLANAASAQLSPATEDDIKEAPKGFQDILRGKRTTIDQQAGMSAGGPPGGMGAGGPPKLHPSSDPQDIHGTWSGGGMMGAGGELSKTQDGKRPGPRVDTKVEVSRICWVDSGVAPANMTIYQTDKQITIVKGDDLRVRHIYMNEEHPKNVTPTYGGHSVGHWDGDTLVIDTVGLKGALQAEGFDVEVGAWTLVMTTPTLHVVERIKKIDNGAKLQIVQSFDDAATNMEPYTITRTANYAPGTFGMESECEDFNDAFGPNYPGETR